jgi:hypothetical protein
LPCCESYEIGLSESRKRRVERDWNLKVAFYWTIATRRLAGDILIKLVKTAWDMAALRRWD